MSTFSSNKLLTLNEILKRKDPRGGTMRVSEVLVQENAMLQDLPFMEANDSTSHLSTIRIGYALVRVRRYNRGSVPSAGSTQQNRDVIESREIISEQDSKMLANYGDPEGQRDIEHTGALEVLAQSEATAMIYANNATDKDSMTGLAARMAASNDTTVLKTETGSGGDTTSIYMIVPGPGKVYATYPKGSNAGIFMEDHSQRLKDEWNGTDTTVRKVYSAEFRYDAGLVVEDDRCMARYGNIEITGSVDKFDWEQIISIQSELRGSGKGAIGYVNRKLYAQIQIAAFNKSNAFLTLGNVFGDGDIPMINGMPVRLMEAITNTETAIT